MGKHSLLAVLTLGLLFTMASAEPLLDWSSSYDGGSAYMDEAKFVRLGADGNPVVAGISYDGILGSDIIVIKYDRQDGSQIWERRVPSFDDNDMEVTGLAHDHEGRILVAGYVAGCPE